VKFYNFSSGAPNVNFYANDTKLTGVSSTNSQESTIGTAFGGVAAGGFYAALAPGQYTLSGRITATTDNGLAIAAVPTTLADGKYYSFYLSGLYNATTKQSDSFIVEDPIPPQLDYTVTTVRFVHGVYTATGPMTLWLKNPVTKDSVSIGPVAYKAASPFITIPNPVVGTIPVYDLTVRYPGSNTAVLTRTGIAFPSGRVFTVSARAGTGTTLDVTGNR
jgi:hypothetical protein